MSGFGRRNRPESAGFHAGFHHSAPIPAAETWRGAKPSFRPSIIDVPSIPTGGRSVFMAYLWWFFFGNVGGHRFYVGRIASGLVLAFLTIVGWLLMLVYFVGLIILIPVWLFVLIDAFRIPGWVRGY